MPTRSLRTTPPARRSPRSRSSTLPGCSFPRIRDIGRLQLYRLGEHTVDAAGQTLATFAIFNLAGLQFSPRIRDIGRL
jgi:hypothetical protein